MGLDHRVRCCPDGLVTDRRRRIKVLDCTIRDGGFVTPGNFKSTTITRFLSIDRSWCRLYGGWI